MRRSISRVKFGKRFGYMVDGVPLHDDAELERIKSLAIPPAWKDVEIALSSRANVQATGRDKAGRKQIIYSSAYRARQEAAKFARLQSFGRSLPALRRQIEHDLAGRKLSRDKVLACVVKLLDEAYFRVGNDIYARSHQTYGVTTMRSKHTLVRGDKVTFNFVGKSGKLQRRKIINKQVAKLIRRLDNMPGREIFQYYDDSGTIRPISSRDVNSYIRRHMGQDFTAKDFRTWGGTVLATAELAVSSNGVSAKSLQKSVRRAVKRVAKRLGNTPAVARSSYIDPRIIEAFLSGRLTRQSSLKLPKRKYLAEHEQLTMRLIDKPDKTPGVVKYEYEKD